MASSVFEFSNVPSISCKHLCTEFFSSKNRSIDFPTSLSIKKPFRCRHRIFRHVTTTMSCDTMLSSDWLSDDLWCSIGPFAAIASRATWRISNSGPVALLVDWTQSSLCWWKSLTEEYNRGTRDRCMKFAALSTGPVGGESHCWIHMEQETQQRDRYTYVHTKGNDDTKFLTICTLLNVMWF